VRPPLHDRRICAAPPLVAAGPFPDRMVADLAGGDLDRIASLLHDRPVKHPQGSMPGHIDSLPNSAWNKQILVEGLHMNEFIEERARLVRVLADKADPFTKVRLVKLAEKYDERLGLGSRPARQRKMPIGLPQISRSASER
jgi:hypothetical protein